jgi:hypothetical protein
MTVNTKPTNGDGLDVPHDQSAKPTTKTNRGLGTIYYWTEFNDVQATQTFAKSGTYAEFIERLKMAGSYPDKASCPLLKMTTFGNKRNKSGAMRSNDNTVALFGIEGDYDCGVITSVQAIDLLERAQIRALVYPSPSSTAACPKWRVICPLATQHTPNDRAKFVGRLNGVLGGVLDECSFNESQAFYFGATPGNDYSVLVSFDDPDDGTCIDNLLELDQTAIGKQNNTPKTQNDACTNAGTRYCEPQTVLELQSALSYLNSDDYHEWIAIGHALKELGQIGFGLWDNWSQTSHKYDPLQAGKWHSFTSDRTGYEAVFKRAQRTGWINPRSRLAKQYNAAQAASGALLIDDKQRWPEPIPLPDALPPVDPFDAELLPVALRAWVMDIAHRMQCPADFPAVAALVALSSLIGARAVIQPKAKDDWQVVPNLWGAVVGRPGVKKSPALGEALKPLNRLQAAEFELWQAAHEAWELDCKVTAMQDDANEKKAKGHAAKGDTQTARQLLAPLDTPTEPTARRYIVNDATVEKLGELMQQNEWGTLSYRDELYGLLTGLDKQGQEGSRAFYLQSYDGNQGYTFDRIGRGTVHIPRVCLAMIGGIQPGRIQEYVRGAVAGGSADDGLLQRFGLTVWPDVTGDFVHVDQWPDTPAKQTAWAVFERLAQLQPASDTDPVIWRFSPEAQDLFVEWLVPFEIEIRGDELHPAMVSHLSKYRKLIPALALVFALIDTPDSGGVIHEGELLRALAWGDYLRSHANRLYAAAVIPETTDAVTLLARIKGGKLADKDGVIPDNFTPRQVAMKHWAGLATPEAVRKAADVLVEYDYLRRDIVQAGAAGGRPSDRYLIHPALLKGGAV